MKIKLKKGMLIGEEVFSPGDVIPDVSEEKGNKMIKLGYAEAVKSKPAKNNKSNNESIDTEAVNELVKSGIDDKSAELLVSAGLKTPDEIRGHKDLTKIRGIGKTSAEKILAALVKPEGNQEQSESNE